MTIKKVLSGLQVWISHHEVRVRLGCKLVKEELVKEELFLGLLQSSHIIKFYKAYDGG